MKSTGLAAPDVLEATCSIERTLDLVGDRWSFLILRQSLMYGSTKFSEFEAVLKIAPNILTDRLEKMVQAGVLEKQTYKEPGARARNSYHSTKMGERLVLVLTAMQQWGDDNVPLDGGPSVLRRSAKDDRPLHLALVDDDNTVIPMSDIRFRTAPGFDF